MTSRELHKHRNTAHTLILLVSMFCLMLLLGAGLVGVTITLIMITLSVILLLMLPQTSGWMTLRLYHAEPIAYYQAPQLYRIAEDFSRRAELPYTPALYLLPSTSLNAFTLEVNHKPVIVFTTGLLRNMEMRQLRGVMAHEIGHIRNGDLFVMMLADFFSQITTALSYAGIVLMLIFLPLWILTEYVLPWGTLLLLLIAPMLSTLLQRALSRTREFDADVGAVSLTSDPLALAEALGRIEQVNSPGWSHLMFPGEQQALPSLLRTHPATSERIERLQQMAQEYIWEPRYDDAPEIAMSKVFNEAPPSRWHPFGIWF
ncbi:MAG: zinc metalloprotease HtpX [Mariprofundaceae bacterium]